MLVVNWDGIIGQVEQNGQEERGRCHEPVLKPGSMTRWSKCGEVNLGKTEQGGHKLNCLIADTATYTRMEMDRYELSG